MSLSETARIIGLAQDGAKAFVRKTRPQSEESFTTITDDAPEWLAALVHDAHGDFLPDDYRYAMICSAVQAIADAGDDADLDDVGTEWADQEPDMWNASRAAWLASSNRRAAYIEDAVSEFGVPEPFDIHNVIGMGWYMEAREVFGLVLNGLRELANDTDTDDDEETA
jgi:hypothetical protein